MDEQIELIENIGKNITKAAVKASKEPPKFVLSVLFIPDWEREGNSYTDTIYDKTKKIFFDNFLSKIDQKNGRFQIKDAYEETSGEEQKYLHKLKNKGANADWNKTKAIIFNKKHKHLQLDSNTQIINYDKFYAQTFGQDQVFDGLNASAYDENASYVSPHNKVVYTMPGGKIVDVLAEVFSKYCSEHQNPCDPEKNKNSIYSNVFCQSLVNIGLATCIDIPVSRGEIKKRYLVIFNNPEYRLTKYVITAVNGSWNDTFELDPYSDLKETRALEYLDAKITFRCFHNLVRVHTGLFQWHKDRNCSFDEFLSSLLNEFRNNLHDRDQDIKIITAYYTHIEQNYPNLLLKLAEIIPPKSQHQNLCFDAFKCTLDALKKSATAAAETSPDADTEDAIPKGTCPEGASTSAEPPSSHRIHSGGAEQAEALGASATLTEAADRVLQTRVPPGEASLLGMDAQHCPASQQHNHQKLSNTYKKGPSL